jgi:hypothetical protein
VSSLVLFRRLFNESIFSFCAKQKELKNIK